MPSRAATTTRTAKPTGCWAAREALASPLGMKRSTLHWKIKKLDISRPQYSAARPRRAHVFVNGVQVPKDGDHTGAKPERFVHGPGWKG